MVEPGSTETNTGRFIPALQFRFLTPIYDFVIGLTMREGVLRQLHIESMRLEPGMSVLDLGCGTGTLAIRIKQTEPAVSVVGLDPDPDILRIAASKAEHAGVDLELRRARAEKVPFEDHQFDLVVSSLAFHHLPPNVKRMALSEAFRVLRPGGRMSIADFGPPRTRVGLAATLPIRLLDGQTTADNFLGRLPSLIEGAGFSDVKEVRRIGTAFGPVCFYSASRP